MRRAHNINVTHVMADGKVLTDEQFFAHPYPVIAEENYDLLKESNLVLDPNYLCKDALRRKYERAEARRKELEKLQESVQAQLKDLSN